MPMTPHKARAAGFTFGAPAVDRGGRILNCGRASGKNHGGLFLKLVFFLSLLCSVWTSAEASGGLSQKYYECACLLLVCSASQQALRTVVICVHYIHLLIHLSPSAHQVAHLFKFSF